MGSQPVKSTPSWPLCQLLALGYCPVCVPVLMWKRKPNNPFPLQVALVIVFHQSNTNPSYDRTSHNNCQ